MYIYSILKTNIGSSSLVHVLHCVTAALVDLLKDGGTMIVYQNPWKSLKKNPTNFVFGNQ